MFDQVAINLERAKDNYRSSLRQADQAAVSFTDALDIILDKLELEQHLAIVADIAEASR